MESPINCGTNCITAKQFFDTNILIYAFDSSDPANQKTAVQHVLDAVRTRTGVISTQVLGEYFHSLVVRKRVLTAAEGFRAINDFVSGFEVSDVTVAMVQKAITIHQKYQLRYWDSLIIATAIANGCDEIVSEDMNHVQNYNGTMVRNPF